MQSSISIQQVLFLAIEASLKAGQAILDVYTTEFTVEQKDDKSPLTLADKKAHEVIQNILLSTSILVLSEEGKTIPYSERNKWNELWIVDPLDGTKEFVKRNGEFTVNIALVSDGVPILGVIYQPVTDILYFGEEETGAFRINEASKILSNPSYSLFSKAQKLPASELPSLFTIVASRSHLSHETAAFIEEAKREHGKIDLISSGSSLKLCMIAENKAHVYPRFAPTMEWDIAAGHAILKAAGKNVYAHSTGNELHYNKPDLLNEWFIAK